MRAADRRSVAEEGDGRRRAEPRHEPVADVAIGNENLETCTLLVEGLDCASCAASVDRALRTVAGVEAVQTDIVGERVMVDYSPRLGDEEKLKAAIRRAGYRVRERAPAIVA